MKCFVFKNFQDFSGKFQLQLLFTVAERQNLNPRIIFAAFGDIYTDFDDTEQKFTLQKSNLKIIHSRIKIYNQS